MDPTMDAVGYLRVFVRTAGGSLPVKNAAVTVWEGDERIAVLYTDRSGLTPLLPLAAPPLSESQAVGGKGYADYRVEVAREGFYRQVTQNVPIFPGVTALQPINLVGLAEMDSDTLVPNGSTQTVPRDPQSLGNGRGEA